MELAGWTQLVVKAATIARWTLSIITKLLECTSLERSFRVRAASVNVIDALHAEASLRKLWAKNAASWNLPMQSNSNKLDKRPK